MGWKLIYLGERNPFEGNSYPEAFKIAIERKLSPNSLVIWKSDRPAVQGNYAKIKHEFCEQQKIAITRWLIHGPNGLYIDSSLFIMHTVYRPSEKLTNSEIISEWIAKISKALRRLGLDAAPRKDGNDVRIKGKKVTSAITRSFGEIQVIGSDLIMDFNFEVAEKATIPKHNLRETITGINDVSERKFSDDEIVLALKEELEESLQEKVGVFYELTEAEREIVASLREKYTSEKWIKYGKWSPVKEYWRPE